MKLKEKQKAVELRGRGYSLGEISVKLNVSKSTVSLWTKHVKINNNGKDRIKERSRIANIKSSTILHNRKLERLDVANIESEKLIKNLKINKDVNLIALSIMYWCEGTKDDSSIRFTNSDPSLIRMFMKLFRESFVIDEKRIKVCVHLHDYHNEEEICNFWSEVTGVPRAQFNKVYRKQSNHTYTKDGYKGCIRINYHDAHIARVIVSFAKKLMKHYI